MRQFRQCLLHLEQPFQRRKQVLAEYRVIFLGNSTGIFPAFLKITEKHHNPGQFFILCSVNRRSLEKICAVTTFKKGKLGNFQLHSVLIPAKLESKRRRTILQLSFLCLPRHSFQCEFYLLQRFHKRVYGPALNSKIAV